MTEQPADRREPENGARGGDDTGSTSRRPAGDPWERRAAGLASEVQRWLIKTSARSMRDELGDQVRKAFRGQQRDSADVWATATTEPPGAADEAPECAWCPVCRAARRIAESRVAAGAGNSVLSDAADVVSGAVRDALAGIDSILSYRPSDGGVSGSGDAGPKDSDPGDSVASSTPASGAPASGAPAMPAEDHAAPTADGSGEPADEPDHRS